ncbi:MAG: TonB-dependent receptor [Burkholderiaceae bacterium]|nr:MAG: TonB-dependent receptor [Burkholderiaceae bacterium]
MLKMKPLVKLMAVSVGLVGLSVQAQQAEPKKEEPQKLERVEITGSNIKRVSAETAVPVQVITRAEIESKGFTTVKALLDDLTSSTGGLSDIGGSSSFAAGSSNVSMRNLGASSTLILLNGRRVAPYGLANYAQVFTNIDSLPYEAIERIEVLKSGASAIYGSDAVAGVINFITRKDYKGGHVKASMSDSLRTFKFGEHNASLTYGFGDLATQRFNVLANISMYHRDPLFYSDIWKYTDERLTRYSSIYGTPSTFSYPGNVAGKPVDGCTTKNAGGLCVYDRYSRFQALPESNRINGMLAGRYLLGADTELFTELTFSQTKTDYQSAHQTYGGGSSTAPVSWFDTSTNTPKLFSYADLPATHPLSQSLGNGKASELRYRFVDANTSNKAKAQEYRFIAGVKGVFGEWDWESAFQTMGSKVELRQRGSFSDSGFKAVIGDYNNPGADFFNKPNGYKIGQPNSAAVLNQLFPEYGYNGKLTQTGVDFKASRTIGNLPGGPIGLALGTDIRNEKGVLDPSSNLRTGDIVGNGVSASDASRNFGAVFTELSLPLHKTLEVQAAARVDKFPGFGAHISPKAAFRYQPNNMLMVRGTIESGFRAPNLSEAAPSMKVAYEPGNYDPQRCEAAYYLATDLENQALALPASDPNRALLLARSQQVYSAECSTSVTLVTRSNPDLKPETSRSFSLGFVVEPIKNFSVAVDYWHIERKDEITQRGAVWYLQREGTSEVNGEITRLPLSGDTTFTPAEQALYGVTAGPLQYVTDKFRNVSRTRTSGVDFEVVARASTSFGKVRGTVNGTYLDSYRSAGEDGRYSANYAGFRGAPRLRTSLSLVLERTAWTHALQFTNTSSTPLMTSATDTDWSVAGCKAKRGIIAEHCTTPSHTNVNYFVSFRPVKAATVSLNIINVLNDKPALDVRGFLLGGSGVVPQSYGEAYGRGFRLTGSYNF